MGFVAFFKLQEVLIKPNNKISNYWILMYYKQSLREYNIIYNHISLQNTYHVTNVEQGEEATIMEPYIRSY